MAKIFIFRHGETYDNKAHDFSGWRNVDLDKEGIVEAEKIRDELKNEPVTIAYQSDLLRSQRTLEIALEGHSNAEVKTDPRIKERDYGDLTNSSKDLLKEEEPENFQAWHRSYDVAPPGGESIKQVEERVLSFLAEELPKWKEDDVIFISAHGNSIRPMRRFFENLTIEDMVSYENVPGKIYRYEI